MILESGQPIMSPAWSADGQWLAYVSFENRRVGGVRAARAHRRAAHGVGARRCQSARRPSRPMARSLALTLSGTGGNLDIWLLDLATQALTRLTDDPAIDTEAGLEPGWQEHLLHLRSRGRPADLQARCSRNPQRVQRITFDSTYSARPRLSPDGKELAFVTRDGANYRIAVQDLASGTVTVLSHGRLDESPSFAPNGAVIIYAGRDAQVGTLQTVSVDGLVTQRLNSDPGDEVREPVWGPFAS